MTVNRRLKGIAKDALQVAAARGYSPLFDTTMGTIDFRHPRGLDKSLVLWLADCQWTRSHNNLIITDPTGVCGDLHQGFAIIKCPDCQHEYLLAYSCGGRWFPESRTSLTSRVAITRRWFSSLTASKKQSSIRFPIGNMFSQYLRFCVNSFSTTENCWASSASVAAKSLTKFFKIRLGKKTGIPGIVVAIQTFTAKTTLLEIMSVGIPISNALVADGLFMESGCFYVVPKVDLKPLRELFRAYLLKMFKKKD